MFGPFPNPKNSPLWPQKVKKLPQKVKNYPKIESKSNVRIERNKENESCSTTWVDPKSVVEPYPSLKNSPLGPQKVKNDPKIESKSNVEIERNKENESSSTTWVDPKSMLNPTPTPKIAVRAPKTKKITPKSSKNQISKLTKT